MKGKYAYRFIPCCNNRMCMDNLRKLAIISLVVLHAGVIVWALVTGFGGEVYDPSNPPTSQQEFIGR